MKQLIAGLIVALATGAAPAATLDSSDSQRYVSAAKEVRINPNWEQVVHPKFETLKDKPRGDWDAHWIITRIEGKPINEGFIVGLALSF